MPGGRTGPRTDLTWQEVTPFPYSRVEVPADAAFADVRHRAEGTTSLSLSLDSLTYGQTYYWRVRGRNGGGDGSWSETNRFTAISRPGDFDASGRIDFDDFFSFADASGSGDLLHDMDGDGLVGFDDFFAFADVFGS